MMKTRFIYCIIVLLAFASCEKSAKHTVKYLVSEAKSEITITYKGENEELSTENIAFHSAQDTWNVTFVAEEGDIVYLSAIYADTLGSVKSKILIDGKVYKEGFSKYDPQKYITVSGSIPFYQ
ncbi:MAG: hypothetical protein KKA07_18290 [Bacteroidetes bacterium]|nr:hypothetical protein [Bacteroidota bacterium]MBU1721021.1 hypothetical protein [Bacteroidota bacterium]